MKTGIDTDSFGFLVTDLSRLVRAEMDRRIGEAEAGVTPGEARTLAHLARAGRVRQNVLADRMGVEAMTVSGYLDRLEARGLVYRTPDPGDRRAKLVDITPAAEAALAAVKRAAGAIRSEASASIAEADWSRLLEFLKTARDNLTDARRNAEGGEESSSI